MSEVDSFYTEVDEFIDNKQKERVANVVNEFVSDHQESISAVNRFINCDVWIHDMEIINDKNKIGLDRDHQQEEHSIMKDNVSDLLMRENMKLMTQYNKTIDLFSKDIVAKYQNEIELMFTRNVSNHFLDAYKGKEDVLDLELENDKFKELFEKYVSDKKLIDEINKEIVLITKTQLTEPLQREFDILAKHALKHLDQILDRHDHKVSIVDSEVDAPVSYLEYAM